MKLVLRTSMRTQVVPPTIINAEEQIESGGPMMIPKRETLEGLEGTMEALTGTPCITFIETTERTPRCCKESGAGATTRSELASSRTAPDGMERGLTTVHAAQKRLGRIDPMMVASILLRRGAGTNDVLTTSGAPIKMTTRSTMCLRNTMPMGSAVARLASAVRERLTTTQGFELGALKEEPTSHLEMETMDASGSVLTRLQYSPSGVAPAW